MRRLLTLLLLLPLACVAEVVTVDFVKVLNGNDADAVYYYENNWKRHRIEAAKRGYISSYKLLVKTSDDGQTDILLITGYASESDYDNREETFREEEKGVEPRFLLTYFVCCQQRPEFGDFCFQFADSLFKRCRAGALGRLAGNRRLGFAGV